MKKETILELLKIKLIDVNDEDKLKCLLDLSDDEEKLLMDNIDLSFKYFIILYSLKKYEKKGNSINDIKNLDKIFILKNKKILNKIYKLISNDNLMNSSFYREVIETFLSLDFNNIDVNYFNLLIDLITNKSVLSNQKCKNIILDIVTKNNEMPYGCFGVFCKIAANPQLIMNPNYDDIISECLNITEEDKMELIKNLVTNKNLLLSSQIKKVVSGGFNINEANRLITYVNTFINSNVLNSAYFDTIYDKFFKLKEDNHFSYYQYIVTKKDLLNSPYLEQTIDTFINLKNTDVAKVFYRAVTNSHLINSNYFLEILNIIGNYENVDELKLFKRIACDNKLLKHPNYLTIINMAKSIHDYDTLDKFKEAACNTNLIKTPYYIYTLKIFKNKKYAKYLDVYLKLISNVNFVKSRKYYEAFEIITTIEDLELLNKIYYVAIDSYVLSSDYYLYTLSKLITYSDSPIFDKIIRFSYNADLLFSNYYGFVFEKLKGIKDEDYFNAFTSVATHPLLLKSNEYIYIINSVLEMDEPTLINKFKDIISLKVVNYEKGIYTHFVVDILKKVTNKEIMNSFDKVINNNALLEREDYLEILVQLSNINDARKFDVLAIALSYLALYDSPYFYRIFNDLNGVDDIIISLSMTDVLCDKRIMELPYYEEILESFETMNKSAEFFDEYSRLLSNSNLLDSNYHKLILDYAKNYDDSLYLKEFSKYATNKILLSNPRYEEVINVVYGLTIKPVVNYKALTDLIDWALKSSSGEIVDEDDVQYDFADWLDILISKYHDFLVWCGCEPLYMDNDVYLIDLIPKAIDKNKLEDLLNQIDDKENINSKTRINKKDWWKI